MRRGWVTPMWAESPRPMARQILGSWVVLPEPVSPATMTTGEASIAQGDVAHVRGDRELFGEPDGGRHGAGARKVAAFSPDAAGPRLE